MVFAMIGYFAMVGLVGALCGEQRGRRNAGFWLGVLLGPIGWAAVFLGPDRRSKCPHCRSPLLAADAAVCARCGREAAPQQQPAAFRLAADPGDAELQAAADRRAAGMG